VPRVPAQAANQARAVEENRANTLFSFDNSYARDLDGMHLRVSPAHVAAPHLIAFNTELAQELGLQEGAHEKDLSAVFSGNVIPSGADPLAMAYAGHQFGHFVPQLGDGRAILLGEVIDQRGARRDIQLKGAGPTPFSRRGDGRAALGPVLREYIVSEAMHALGIPATRALAAVLSGERVQRETGKPGAVFTRVAASHIRVGTFQFFAARGDMTSVKRLADYAIDRHYPDVKGTERPYVAFLEAVMGRQARLIAQWMGVGFIHGVMNTDNMAISGETIDFGPCAFLDTYIPGKVFSSIDEHGRYAYANQSAVARWNLARLAETLAPLLNVNEDKALDLANEMISAWPAQYARHYLDGMRRKLGLQSEQIEDAKLISGWLSLLKTNAMDFTNSFRALGSILKPTAPAKFRMSFTDLAAFDVWHAKWLERLETEGLASAKLVAALNAANPKYTPRNHRIEQAIRAAEDEGDFSLFHELVEVLKNPFDEQPQFANYASPPAEGEEVLRTFCGT
jgi:serine/tyrosine/threonine adenylyltransferase